MHVPKTITLHWLSCISAKHSLIDSLKWLESVLVIWNLTKIRHRKKMTAFIE